MVRWLLYTVFVVIGYVVVKYLATVLAPILAAFGIAYLLDPLVERMVARGVSRMIAATLVLLAFASAVIGTIIALSPRVWHEVALFIRELPPMIDNIAHWARDTLGVEVPADWKAYLKSADFEVVLQDAAGPVRALATAALGGVFVLLGLLAELLLVPVFAYYFLLDWKEIKHRLSRMVPPRRRARVLSIVGEVDAVVAGWVRGQATVT